jgi:hypothetical protein
MATKRPRGRRDQPESSPATPSGRRGSGDAPALPKKSTRKSALPDGRVAPGRGPKKGAPNAGRPRTAFRDACRAIIDRDELLKEVSRMATGSFEDRDRLAAIKFLTSYAHGMPSQTVRTETVDLSTLSDAQLERLAAGDDLAVVLARP